jgi:hypothetical protein
MFKSTITTIVKGKYDFPKLMIAPEMDNKIILAIGMSNASSIIGTVLQSPDSSEIGMKSPSWDARLFTDLEGQFVMENIL